MRPSSSSEAMARATISFSVKSLNFLSMRPSWTVLLERKVVQKNRTNAGRSHVEANGNQGLFITKRGLFWLDHKTLHTAEMHDAEAVFRPDFVLHAIEVIFYGLFGERKV